MNDSHTIDDVRERIAVLEDRTKPRKKTFLEKLKDYGGIAALVIALGYSWPLGVWEKFVITPNQARQARISELRDVLADISNIIANGAGSISGIADPNLRNMANQSFVSQIGLLLTKHGPSFKEERQSFLPDELFMIGSYYSFITDTENAKVFYTFSLEGAEIRVATAALQQLGNISFAPSAHQDIEIGRSYFQRVLSPFDGTNDTGQALQEITIRSTWGLNEMRYGDWKCGEIQTQKSLELARKWQYFLNDRGQTQNQIRMQMANLRLQPNQPANGCD